jgi:hypothetical protein
MLILEGVVMKSLDNPIHHYISIQTNVTFIMYCCFKHSMVFILVKGNTIPYQHII